MAVVMELLFFFLVFFSLFPKVAVGLRYGHPSQTIHFPSSTSEDVHGPGIRVFSAVNEAEGRGKREAGSGVPATDSKFNVSLFTLNDSHTQLIVHWAGQGSSVVVALARNNNKLTTSPGSSALFISYDHGCTFEDRKSMLQINGSTPSSINKFYNSPVYNSHYVFADVQNQYIFTTTDFGKSFTKNQVPFVPDEVGLHITNELVIVAMDKKDTEKKLWLSEDFGETWTVMQMHVKSYFWGVKGLDEQNTLYVEREEPNGQASVLTSNNFFRSDLQSYKILIDGVDDFEVRDKYLFATKRQKLFGSSSPNGTLQLWVSYNRGPFLRATFPNRMEHTDYYIPDASDNQVFVCVNHGKMDTNLYISDAEGIRFSLSMERILYFKPHGAGSDTWLSIVADEDFADFHKVAGLHGVYIASQLRASHNTENFGPEDLISMITFDKGAEWKPLLPPSVDENGRPTNCKLSENCSLHVTQRFSQLYPASRTIPILSKSSAIGLIMASGVMGKSLKGHPGVFVSADAGVTWHKVLDGNYFYTYGDHGGLIVAVKLYNGEGSTNEILYSVDEGETWQSLIFSNEKINVFGLMTEPGERTTTVTLFGSKSLKHQWFIVTIDLRNAFPILCRPDDYKNWSPTSRQDNSRNCLMGRREVFQRRIAHANCYNGEEFERVVSLENCECRIEDYECDVGFKWLDDTFGKCVQDSESVINPFGIPENCMTGTFYNRSRGYRKVSGDSCEGGIEATSDAQKIPCPMKAEAEFILFTQRQAVSRLALNDDKGPEPLPLPSLKNVIAVEFDVKNNCVYWADIDEDKIMRQCLDGKSEPEIIVESKLETVEGLALDWLSKNLYFVDGERAKIELVRTDIQHMGRMRRTVLEKPNLDKPRGIALHPVKGFMFWTDWNVEKPYISRANLDGSNIHQIILKPTVFWPNGIVIDHRADRIYWVDAKLDYIASADFNGDDLKYLIRNSAVVPHPFAIGIYKEWMYWDDWTRQSILVADKVDGEGVQVIAPGLPGLMDLKIYEKMEVDIPSVCHPNGTNLCPFLCVPTPQGGANCLCPDGFVPSKLVNGSESCACNNGEKLLENGTCLLTTTASCSTAQFHCHGSNLCVPLIWQCDGDNDCGDNSDEQNCGFNNCTSNQFSCANGKCILLHWRCDFDNDCLDESDEKGCIYDNCTLQEFHCNNGRCIDKRWQCDMEDDCRDGSDEVNCTTPVPEGDVTCRSNEFRCQSGNQCLHQSWRCDGDGDCLDRSDEANCSNHDCQPWQFKCGNGGCVYNTWRCDGDNDCHDASDEQNCSSSTTAPPAAATTSSSGHPVGSCSPWMFTCGTGNCIPIWWKCDKVTDCSDGSDELDCPYSGSTTSTSNPTSTSGVRNCGTNHFQCFNGDCIWQSWVCDAERDCISGEDEANCTIACRSDHFRCSRSAGCVPLQHVCNNVIDCADGSDEWGCSSSTPISSASTKTPWSCGRDSFQCNYGLCIPIFKRCDGHPNCLDNSDEINCTEEVRDYPLLALWVDTKQSNSTSVTINWVQAVFNHTEFMFMPSISESNSGSWTNVSWLESTEFTFVKLNPYTLYNFTVYVKPKGSSHVSPSVHYIHFRTMPDVPSPPRNVTVKQVHSRLVVVHWEPPLHANAPLVGYRLYISPPKPPLFIEILSLNTFNWPAEDDYEPGKNYTFWVTAVAPNLESDASNVVNITIDKSAVMERVKGLKTEAIGNFSVLLNWTQVRQSVDGYQIVIVSTNSLTQYKRQQILVPPYNVTGLSPGATYTLKVYAFKGDSVGPPSDVKVRTLGEKLKNPRNLLARLVNGTTVSLTWELPLDTRNVTWEYGIYYGRSMGELKRPRQMTKDLRSIVTSLGYCEKYLFDVRLVGPYGMGPSNGAPATIVTSMDVKEPPQNVHVTYALYDPKSVIISWRASCDQISDALAYKVIIYDVITGRDAWYQMAPTTLYEISYPLIVHYGGNYTVQIKTLNDGASLCTPVRFHGPPLPQPFELKGDATGPDSFHLTWSTKKVPPALAMEKFRYIVRVSKNFNESSVKVYESNVPTFDVTDLIPGHAYSFSIVLKNHNGYISKPSESLSIVMPLDGSSVILSTVNIVEIVVPILVVITALLAALSFLYVRHRRLQKATLSFANSHYNTRLGTTTFLTGDELDEEDSPMIRGFSDDEPLVIA